MKIVISDFFLFLSFLLAEKLATLVSEAGFEIVENHYVIKETVNKKEGFRASRVFIQGKFRKTEVEIKSQ